MQELRDFGLHNGVIAGNRRGRVFSLRLQCRVGRWHFYE
jgi:hypothetical protein